MVRFKQINILSGRMVELDEFLPDEAKNVAISLRKTTSNLVRAFFNNPELMTKLR
jgi:hypothetical protein